MSTLCNALTVDVEDYFQVQAFAGVISRDWDALRATRGGNTDRVLALFAEPKCARPSSRLAGWPSATRR